MPPVKSLARSSAKWARQSAAATPEFEEGVRSTQKDWADNTQAASQTYASGVTAAIADDRFSKGVARAGTKKWRDNTLLKGPTRWSEGIRQSTGNYERGFAPFRQVIENVTLPPRGPKGSPQNIDRVRAVTEALHQAKLDQVQ